MPLSQDVLWDSSDSTKFFHKWMTLGGGGGVDGLKGDRLGGEESLHWQGLAAGSTPAWESDVPHHPLQEKAEVVVFKWNFQF